MVKLAFFFVCFGKKKKKRKHSGLTFGASVHVCRHSLAPRALILRSWILMRASIKQEVVGGEGADERVM